MSVYASRLPSHLFQLAIGNFELDWEEWCTLCGLHGTSFTRRIFLGEAYEDWMQYSAFCPEVVDCQCMDCTMYRSAVLRLGDLTGYLMQ